MSSAATPAPEGPRVRPLRGLLKRLGALSLGVAVAALLSEVVVRVWLPQHTSWLPIFTKHPELPLTWHQPNADVVVDTGESQWRVVTDARGFRVAPGTAAGGAPDGTVLWLGDSFTFGYSVNWEDCFVGRYQASDGRTRHVNAACGGYGPTQYRMVLERLLARDPKPARVIVGIFLGNDFHDCVWDKPYRPEDSGGGGVKGFLRRNSHAYRLLARTLHRMAGSGPPALRTHAAGMDSASAWTQEPLRSAEPIFAQELARIATLCRERGIPVHAVVIPTYESAMAATAPDGRPPDEPMRRALSALEAARIEAVDLRPVLAAHLSEPLYFRFDGHLTPRGHALVVEAMRARWP